MSNNSNCRPIRISLILCTLLSVLFFSGIIYGWSPILLLLIREKQYIELCRIVIPVENSAIACQAQENRLNLIFIVASTVMNLAALPIGIFADQFGPVVTLIIAGVMEIAGLVLFGVADSKTMDVFLPAYVLLAIGGCATMMISYIAVLRLETRQAFVLAALSCLFDGSSVMFSIMYAVHERFEISRLQLFLVHSIFGILLYPVLINLWSADILQPRVLQSISSGVSMRKDHLIKNEQSNCDTSSMSTDLQASMKAQTRYGSVNETVEWTESEISNQHADNFHCSGVHRNRHSRKSMKEDIVNFEFAYLILFASLQLLHVTLYLGTLNKMLENYGDKSANYYYTKTFSFTMPLSMLFVPSIGFVVEQKGIIFALHVTNILSFLCSALSLVPYLPVQMLNFLVFAAFRAYFFAIVSAYVARIFDSQHFGKIMGIVYLIGSVVCLLEDPALRVTNEYLHGNLSVINCIFVVMNVGMSILTKALDYRKSV